MIALECALEEEEKNSIFFVSFKNAEFLTLKNATLFTASLILRLPFWFHLHN